MRKIEVRVEENRDAATRKNGRGGAWRSEE